MMGLLSRGSVQSYFYLFEGLGINSLHPMGRTIPAKHGSWPVKPSWEQNGNRTGNISTMRLQCTCVRAVS